MAVFAVVAGAAGACTHYRGGPGDAIRSDEACALVDSALVHSGLRDGLGMHGRVTIDVNQYRVRGRFVMTLSAGGDLTFDIASTTMIGGHREDAVLSFYADTLRVLDRERGRFYQGRDVDRLVREGVDAPVDLAELLRLSTARTPACARLTGVEVRRGKAALELRGQLDGRDFELRLEGGRLTRAVWPLPLAGRSREERVEASYQWAEKRLRRLTVYVPGRRWRVRLIAEN
jgi:hypothetical protein